MNWLCMVMGHKGEVHLDYIYGNLPREHEQCERCSKTLKFRRPSQEREEELRELGDIRDGAVYGCERF